MKIFAREFSQEARAFHGCNQNIACLQRRTDSSLIHNYNFLDFFVNFYFVSVGNNPTSKMSSPTPSSADTMSLTSNSSEGEPEHTLNTKCGVCNETYTIPKVLPCFHTFCQPCLEKVRHFFFCKKESRACALNFSLHFPSNYPSNNAKSIVTTNWFCAK